MTETKDQQRIAKVLARSGICSRRDAEKLIEAKRVKVNGQVIDTPATLVTSNDVIEVDDKVVEKPKTTRVWIYHKAAGYVTTHKDPQNRPTVFEDIAQHKLGRVISVGRLDLNSEGLLLLTNDGEFARYAELPTTGWSRCYRVRVYGSIDSKALTALQKGITIDDVNYGSIQVEIPDQKSSGLNTWLLVTLHEGKNREIRRVMEHFGLRVNRLIRISYGPYQLDSLQPRAVKEVDVPRF
jgi:23S rRNA pseudouridine2605 synthase